MTAIYPVASERRRSLWKNPKIACTFQSVGSVVMTIRRRWKGTCKCDWNIEETAWWKSPTDKNGASDAPRFGYQTCQIRGRETRILLRCYLFLLILWIERDCGIEKEDVGGAVTVTEAIDFGWCWCNFLWFIDRYHGNIVLLETMMTLVWAVLSVL